MAVTTHVQSPSTGAVTLPVSAFRAKRDRTVVLVAALVAVLVEQLHPAGAVFRIRHVAVIVASLTITTTAAVAVILAK